MAIYEFPNGAKKSTTNPDEAKRWQSLGAKKVEEMVTVYSEKPVTLNVPESWVPVLVAAGFVVGLQKAKVEKKATIEGESK